MEYFRIEIAISESVAFIAHRASIDLCAIYLSAPSAVNGDHAARIYQLQLFLDRTH